MKQRLINGFIMLVAFVVILIAYQTMAHELDDHSADSIVAQEVDISSEADVKAMLEHSMLHWLHAGRQESIVDAILVFRASLKEEWLNDTMYVIRLRGGSTNSIILHPYHSSGQSGLLSDPAGVGPALIAGAKAEPDVPFCMSYTYEGTERWACAMDVPHYRDNQRQVFLSGFHHDLEDLSFGHIDCEPFVPGTTAADVVDDETLEAFVREAVTHYIDVLTNRGLADLLLLRPCMRRPPWQEGAIYLFRSALSGQVFFHGLSPRFEDSSWAGLTDKEGTDIPAALREVVNSLPPFGGGFLEYYWDDPTDPTDDFDVEQCPNGPNTCAPGTSLKRTYLVRMPSEITGLAEDIFFGSGYYIKEESNGGCALPLGSSTQGKLGLGILTLGLVLAGTLFLRRKSK